MDLEDRLNNNSEVIFNHNYDLIIKLIDLTIQNNLIYDTNFPDEIENNLKKIVLLNNKRNPPEQDLENIDKISIDFDRKEKTEDFYRNEKLKKYSKIFKNRNKTNNNSKKKKILSNNKNNNLFNCNELNSKKICDDYKKSLTIEKNNYIYINKSFSQKDFTENEFGNNKENISSKVKKSFDITNDLNEQIKIKKNNKIVFMNKSLIKKKTKKREYIEKKRKSIYRGVTKNGKKWQTIISYKKNIRYYGVYPKEEIAARAYDIISIKNKGIKARTNFKYNLHQIQKISETNIDFNIKNINENIINLIKEL